MSQQRNLSGITGRATPRKTGMNQTEAAYADHLEVRRSAGEIIDWQFEAMSLNIAPGTRYKPDFLVTTADGFVECHEVKGYWADDAYVRIRVANDRFPFRFVIVKKIAKKHGGGWDIRCVADSVRGTRVAKKPD